MGNIEHKIHFDYILHTVSLDNELLIAGYELLTWASQ